MELYRACDINVFVFSMANAFGFRFVAEWLEAASPELKRGKTLILVGNKSDLRHNRSVNTFEAQRFAIENGLRFFETSAVNGVNVRELVGCVVQSLSKRAGVDGAFSPVRSSGSDSPQKQFMSAESNGTSDRTIREEMDCKIEDLVSVVDLTGDDALMLEERCLAKHESRRGIRLRQDPSCCMLAGPQKCW